MNRKLNITDFKDASYFSERKISSHDLGDGLKSRKEKSIGIILLEKVLMNFGNIYKKKMIFLNMT